VFRPGSLVSDPDVAFLFMIFGADSPVFVCVRICPQFASDKAIKPSKTNHYKTL
jgi:hypothetical protein